MPDTKRWIDDVRRTPAPDLWSGIESRAAVPRSDTASRATVATRVAAALLAIVVVGSAIYALRGLDDGRDRASATGGLEIVRYPLPGPPQPISVGEGAVWVKVGAGDGTENGLWRIDTATGDVREVPVPGGTWSAVGGGGAWLLCDAAPCGGSSAIELDPATGEVRRTVPLPGHTGQIDGVTDGVWITTDAGVHFIDATGEVARSFDIPDAVDVHADGNRVWLSVANSVVAIDAMDGEQAFAVPFSDVCTMDAADGMAWVATCEGIAPETDELMGVDSSGDVMFRRPLEGFGQMRYADGVLWLAQNDPTNEGQIRILRFDPRTGVNLGDPVILSRGATEHTTRSLGAFSPHVFFAVGEGSLWLTDFGAGEVIRVTPGATDVPPPSGSAVPSVADSHEDPPPAVSERLEVSCAAGGVEVTTPVVGTTPDGVRVAVENPASAKYLEFRQAGAEGESAIGAPASPDRAFNWQIEPGRWHVACVDGSGLEAQAVVAAPFEVVDPNGYWIEPGLDCSKPSVETSQLYGDASADELPDLAFAEIQGIEATDMLRGAGYGGTHFKAWRYWGIVIRDGQRLASVKVSFDKDITTIESCVDDLFWIGP